MTRIPKYAAKAVRHRKKPSRFRTAGRFGRYIRRLRSEQAGYMQQERLSKWVTLG